MRHVFECCAAMSFSVLGLFLSGCTAVMYTGDRLPPDMVSTITARDIFVETVDDKKVSEQGFDFARILVKPGKHVVGVTLVQQKPGSVLRSETIRVEFSAEAGHTYDFRPFFPDPDRLVWKLLLFDTQTRKTVPFTKLTPQPADSDRK